MYGELGAGGVSNICGQIEVGWLDQREEDGWMEWMESAADCI